MKPTEVYLEETGGPADAMALGNGRMISRSRAGADRLYDNIVYFAAGIWPSDGISFTLLIPTPVKPFGSMTLRARFIWGNLTAEPMPIAALPHRVTLPQVTNRSSWPPDEACLLLSIGRPAGSVSPPSGQHATGRRYRVE